MRIAGIATALLLAGCAHEGHYLVGDLRIDEHENGLVIWSMRPVGFGDQVGPLLQVGRPRASSGLPEGCFEGFYNPDRMPLDTQGIERALRIFSLCPEQPAPDAYLLRVRRSGETVEVPFKVRIEASAPSDAVLENGRVRLPENAGVFRDHPELIGALVAIGALPPGLSVLEH